MTSTPSSPRVLARDIGHHLGDSVLLQGWVHSYRHLGGLAFLILRDRSGLCQVVLEGDLAAQDLPEEAVITCAGPVNAEPRAPGGHEVRARTLTVLTTPVRPLPFELFKKDVKAGLDTILEHRAYGLRHPKLNAILKVQAAVVQAFREHLRQQDFTEVRTPKIVATGTEGGASLFPVQYFEQRAYLAQSPQLYKQMLVGAGYERVYEVGPAYRAEDHNTSRHLSEFTSLDVEVAFIAGLEDLLALEEGLLKAIFSAVSAQCEAPLSLWKASAPAVGEIPRIPVLEAQEILQRRFRKVSPQGDLDTEGERLLCKYVAGEGRGPAVFLTHYPETARPFYSAPDPDRPGLTATFDCLLGGQEITSGGLRIHQADVLTAAMARRGMNPASFAPYLEIFELGMPPHGGFAIGAERLTALILGLGNAREAAAFPRDRTRLTP